MQYTATPSDFEYLENSIDAEKLFGSDSSLANVFLLQPKYDIKLFVHDNVLFRFYNSHDSRLGWAFPIPLKMCKNPDGYLKGALEYIFETSRREGLAEKFCLCTQEQKAALDACLAQSFSGCYVEWNTNRGDSDYLYLTQNLAELTGSNYQKKRNHISRFNRIYGDRWSFKLFPQNDIADDILYVSDLWFKEKDGENNEALILEKESIRTALDNHVLLKMRGGVVYIDGKPAAMTLASPVSPSVLDIHFEKAVAEHEGNGVFAVINNQFAKTCTDFLYMNREEDIGIEGLRKAKLSYKPTLILDKFYGSVVR